MNTVELTDVMKAVTSVTETTGKSILMKDSNGNVGAINAESMRMFTLFGISKFAKGVIRSQFKSLEDLEYYLTIDAWWTEFPASMEIGVAVSITFNVTGTDKSATIYYLTLDSLSGNQANSTTHRLLRPLMLEIDGHAPVFAPLANS